MAFTAVGGAVVGVIVVVVLSEEFGNEVGFAVELAVVKTGDAVV